MPRTIEGHYRDGKVELAEKPVGIIQSRVLVTFLTSDASTTSPRHLRYGEFAGEHQSTDEDFEIAEWRGDTAEEHGA